MSLIGAWEVDREDARALADLGDVLSKFDEYGDLTYTIRSRHKHQIIKLLYRIEGSVIITDQPSSPRTERTQFSLSDDGVLTLTFDGVPYRFRRVS
ncbi:hypothetical protein ACFW16_33940 [Inquilinus sp. NPDC058860]|uniref:hypothetical protein n=1 Tax=Inquilinus sp. NPDC058860 TaxID=3346652 RepID=UPI0036ABF4A8